MMRRALAPLSPFTIHHSPFTIHVSRVSSAPSNLRGTVSYEVIRDPLWNNIRVDPLALRLVDTAAFQRLRYVRQLGLAYLVYPGASHTRFEHALGAYHLAGRALAMFDERDGANGR